MALSKQKTPLFTTKSAQEDRKWHLVDAKDMTLGRLATQIATLLRGKHKTMYTPHVDSGDFVVVINAAKVRLTGNKMEDKNYYHHTLYMGGLRSKPAKQMIDQSPDEVIRRAVWGMLPKGPLGRVIIKKLKVFSGEQHSHDAQNPVSFAVARS